MFDAPIDAWYVWLGVAAASLVIAGVALSAHSTPAPATGSVADTVDATAAESYGATGVHPIRADAVRLSSHQIALERDDQTASATFEAGPVTPVTPETTLWKIVTGAPPEQVFDSPDDFQDAIEQAQAREPAWRTPTNRLVVRSLVWGDVEATLVGV